MARFMYQARDGRGDLGSGTIAAANVDEAGQLLRADGKFVIKLTEVDDEPGGGMSLAAHAKRCKRSDVIYFAHQMAIMVETGVPLSDALDSLVEQTSNPHMKAVLADINSAVQSGVSLSSALKRHDRVFPPIMTSLIHASEFSGTMGLMLDRVAEYLTKEMKIYKQAKGALMYPAFMAFTAVTVVVLLLTFVLPKFADIYGSKGAALPLPTQILLNISGCMTNYWYFWLGGALAVVFAIVFGTKTKPGGRAADWLRLNFPVVNNMFTQLYLTRSCRTMGTMISAGVPLLDTISIVREITTNSYYQELWEEVDEGIRQGVQLSDPMFRSTLIPRPIVQMIRSGEKSGRLGEVMSRISEFTETEFDQSVKNVTGMIEPVMVVTMGLIIGFIAVSLLLPIFSVGNVVAG